MNQENEKLESIIQEIKTPKCILVTSHLGPDGDAVGSALAMVWLLKALGHEVFCYNADAIPYLYRFLPGVQFWQTQFPEGKNFDATIILDVFDLDRTSLEGIPKKQLGKILVIDHHLTENKHGDLQYIDAKAAATGVLVYRLAKAAQIPISREMAQNLYCCILTDTGSFRYSSANSEAFRIAADLVEFGVEPWRFASQIYESHPIQRLKLLGEVLKTLEVSPDGKVASVHVDQETLTQYHADSEITDGFINFPRSIDTVMVAIFLRQVAEKKWKASLRSTGQVDVQTICSQFGGGGHRNAAGCTVEGELEFIKEKLFLTAEKVCKNQN